MAMSSTEDTPLLPRDEIGPKRRGPYRRVLFATLLLSTTFWFTQTPILYAYRIFNCEEYYEDPSHPPYTGIGDACAITAVETSTAKDISLMIILGTFSGTANLLLTTWQIRNWGLRAAIVQQTFWPALRNLTQIYATFVGGRMGISIMQATQLITILGGGAGYMLAANSYIAEIVEPVERTAAFGVVAGMMMLGSALGYTAGGLANDLISISAPFEITFGLLVPESLFAFLACLTVFVPTRYAHGNGRFWGLTLLGLGAFGGTLATAYVPLMLQLTATNQYGYKPSDNGFLMAANSLSRALFLTFAFPRIIAAGRAWFVPARGVDVDIEGCHDTTTPAREASDGTITPNTLAPAKDSQRVPGLPTDASAFEGVASVNGAAEEPPIIPAAVDKAHGSGFDLAFLRWSMVADAALTALVGLSSRSWHMGAAAVILPLASGTAPACKGVLMDMVPETLRADALAGIALLETLALISTIALFSAVFAFLSDIGHPNLVFFFNASLALLAAIVLFAVRFPRGTLKV
ncbi:hypothetical protein B0H13DRAFT_2054976 [Mycena leptocephala]|nr:hypothetical protein B0H13DRAFT_2054976 [Mycena leptocephala]